MCSLPADGLETSNNKCTQCKINPALCDHIVSKPKVNRNRTNGKSKCQMKHLFSWLANGNKDLVGQDDMDLRPKLLLNGILALQATPQCKLCGETLELCLWTEMFVNMPKNDTNASYGIGDKFITVFYANSSTMIDAMWYRIFFLIWCNKNSMAWIANARAQVIGYVGIPSLDALSAVFGAHENAALSPCCSWYHPTAHCKLHNLLTAASITITLDPVSEVKSRWLSSFLFSHVSSTGPALLDNIAWRSNWKKNQPYAGAPSIMKKKVQSHGRLTRGEMATTQLCNADKCDLLAQTISLRFTFAHGLTYWMRLPVSGPVEVPHIRRLIVQETILFLLLTITTCRQTCAVCLLHSSGLPVESQSGFLALVECQCLVTALVLAFDLETRTLIKMIRIIDLIRCQMAFLLCTTEHTKH